MTELEIWKFRVEEGPFTLSAPRGARVVDVALDTHGAASIWLAVDPDAEPVERLPHVRDGGANARHDSLVHCGTYVDVRQGFVGHVFEKARLEALVAFLYRLIHDHLPVGVVSESELVEAGPDPTAGADTELQVIARRRAARLARG